MQSFGEIILKENLNLINTKKCTCNKDKIISFTLIVSINALIISKLS